MIKSKMVNMPLESQVNLNAKIKRIGNMANDLHFIKKKFRENLLVKNNSFVRKNMRQASLQTNSNEILEKIREPGCLSTVSLEKSTIENS